MNIVVFLGPLFLPEELDFDVHGNEEHKGFFTDQTVASGMLDVKRITKPEENYYKDNEPSRHFTYGFNIFVLMQIFNFINARKIDDTINTFQGIGHSPLFLIIVGIIIVGQVLILTIGNIAFKVATWVRITSNL